ncbi:Uu.00g040490.m01.CDS01 [Anthostomella pinea]|uniref:Uu.00g040490.m01.CDS01 n=1 Tax=Anthostomella pinea TaxID=933095 RepID=A0AAI8YDU7_9PEZI|nr:Uu.00g040490.m01.CDS01 [Anthostomella pinea]
MPSASVNLGKSRIEWDTATNAEDVQATAAFREAAQRSPLTDSDEKGTFERPCSEGFHQPSDAGVVLERVAYDNEGLDEKIMTHGGPRTSRA